MSFAALKKQKGNYADLTKQLEKDKSGGGFKQDDRFWNFEVDKAGNGFAVIRFLPTPEGEDYPYVKRFEHAFKDDRTGKWYIENSRTTIGEDDPVSEANSELWNTGVEEKKEIARKRKRQAKYIVNILVVSDPKHPENDGKNFLWKCGPKIFQKIEYALNPPAEFPDEKSFNPFDFWSGANFKLKARIENKQRSYDKSEFDKPAALFDGDDAALEKLWKAQHLLQPEIAPDKFKSYDVLKSKFLQVIGAVGAAQNKPDAPREPTRSETPAPSAPRRETPAPAPAAGGKEDDDISRYQALLADDD